MKKSILVLTSMVAMVLFGCKETPYINEPGDNKYNYDSIPVVALPDPDADPVGFEIPAGCLNVYEAVDSCRRLPNGGTTQEKHYVKGWVCRLDSKHESGVQQYGNGTFYIAATNDGTTDGFSFEAYQVYGKGKQKLTNPNQVQVGDFVVLRGKLTNYSGTAETVGKGASYIYYSTNPLW